MILTTEDPAPFEDRLKRLQSDRALTATHILILILIPM